MDHGVGLQGTVRPFRPAVRVSLDLGWRGVLTGIFAGEGSEIKLPRLAETVAVEEQEIPGRDALLRCPIDRGDISGGVRRRLADKARSRALPRGNIERARIVGANGAADVGVIRGRAEPAIFDQCSKADLPPPVVHRCRKPIGGRGLLWRRFGSRSFGHWRGRRTGFLARYSSRAATDSGRTLLPLRAAGLPRRRGRADDGWC
jgi:hypothetical protein